MNYELYVKEADYFETVYFKRAITREEQQKNVPHCSFFLQPYLKYRHRDWKNWKGVMNSNENIM